MALLRRAAAASLVLTALLAASCAAGSARAGPGDGRILVAASILPLADFARQVGGEHVEVVTLVPAGASPHTYEPSPSQVAGLARARLLVLNGAGLEYWARDLVDSVDNPDLLVVNTSQGIEILEGEEHHEEAEEGEGQAGRQRDHPGGNPHLWLDPRNALLQVEHIRRALQEADPAHADDYRRNAEAFAARIEALDREIEGQVATWTRREFIAFHPAWDYFARRYGLAQAAVIEASPGREPSPADLAGIIQAARRIEARAIFAEPQFSPKAAERIAEETGSQVLFLDPLGSSLEEPTYLSLMRHNVAQLGEALR